MSFLDNDDNTQQIELIEIGRADALDKVVRNWFIYCAFENSGNEMSLLAFQNYQKALNRYTALYAGVPTELLYEKVEAAKIEKFYGDFATLVLGENVRD